jgi:hypothetical protein
MDQRLNCPSYLLVHHKKPWTDWKEGRVKRNKRRKRRKRKRKRKEGEMARKQAWLAGCAVAT